MGYRKISPEIARELLKKNDVLFVDVRTKSEYNLGHIKNAVSIPSGEILRTAEYYIADKSSKLVVYCMTGGRSRLACLNLMSLGYENIMDMGGIVSWKYETVKGNG